MYHVDLVTSVSHDPFWCSVYQMIIAVSEGWQFIGLIPQGGNVIKVCRFVCEAQVCHRNTWNTYACVSSSFWVYHVYFLSQTCNANYCGTNLMLSVPNRPQSDKESVKLLTLKTISHESGKLPNCLSDEKCLFQNLTWILFMLKHN